MLNKVIECLFWSQNVFCRELFWKIFVRMAEKSKTEAASDKEFQVKFCTKLENFSVPETPFAVPSNIDSTGLNVLIKELLQRPDDEIEFDWLCLGELVRATLQSHVDARNDITAETVIELEYIEKKLPPEPQVCVFMIFSFVT